MKARKDFSLAIYSVAVLAFIFAPVILAVTR